jgi:hypothetical protein
MIPQFFVRYDNNRSVDNLLQGNRELHPFEATPSIDDDSYVSN